MLGFSVFFDALVTAFIVVRQRHVRAVPLRLRLGAPVLLGLIGLLELLHYRAQHPLGGGTTAGLLALLALGAVLGAARGVTARVWRAEGPFRWVVRRATWATIGLWLVSLGAWLLAAGRVAEGAYLVFLAVTYATQRAVEQSRAAQLRRIDPSPDAPPGWTLRGAWSWKRPAPGGGYIEADSEIVPPHPDQHE